MRVESAMDGAAANQIVTESQNISASGVYCLSPHYMAPLSKVALTIVLPGQAHRNGTQRLLKCEGIVVRCLAPERGVRDRQYQLACSFVGLEQEYRKALDEFVAWRNLQALRTPRTAGRTRTNGAAGAAASSRRTATARPRSGARSSARPARASSTSRTRGNGRAAATKTTARSRAKRTASRGRRSLS
jgi:hypothetical protein